MPRQTTRRIAIIAPLHAPVAATLYGGVLDFVQVLAEELVTLGHTVTTFALGDSDVAGELVAPADGAGRFLQPIVLDALLRRKNDFDIVHNFMGPAFFPVARLLDAVCLTTVTELVGAEGPLYEHFDQHPLVVFSTTQEAGYRPANVVAQIPAAARPSSSNGGEYLAVLGPIHSRCGVADAMRIALATNSKIEIVGEVLEGEDDYFETWLRAGTEHPDINYRRRLDLVERQAFLGGARALLSMSDDAVAFEWTLVEAIAAGTPVIALDRPSAREVVEPGINGFLVADNDEAVRCLDEDFPLSADTLREDFDARFDPAIIAGQYLSLYRQLAG